MENTDAGKDVGFSQYPVYYDSSLVYTYKHSKNNKFKLIAVGSSDAMEIVDQHEMESSRFSDTITNKSRFGEVIGEWHYKDGDFSSVFSPMVRVDRFVFDFGPRANFQYTNYQLSLSEKAEYKLSENHRIKGGVRFISGLFDMDSTFFAPPKEGEISYSAFQSEINDNQNLQYYLGGFYLMDMITLGNWIITPGFNVLLGKDQEYYKNIDPRLQLKYKVFKELTLKAAGGIYSKLPSEEERMEPWGTKGLDPEHSFHSIGGFEALLSDNVTLDIQGFYKWFWNMVVRPDTNNPTAYTNEGIGKAYGAEILLRHNMTENFFGWLSYSYSVSKRKDGSDRDWRYFDLDITHNLTAVASYKLNKYWQFGARFNYSSGLPYTNLQGVETMYDADNSEYVPVYSGKINDDRMESRHQLDLRIDKYWLFDNWILSTYLDVQNAYMRKNAISYAYNDDYTEKKSVTMLPVMVFLGLKGDF